MEALRPRSLTSALNGQGRRARESSEERWRKLFDCATWLHKAKEMPKVGFKCEVERHLTGKETEPWEIIYFKLYKESAAYRREGPRNSCSDAGEGQISGLLPGDDLRRFSRARVKMNFNQRPN